MFFLAMWTALMTLILGAIIGRAYERNKWQQRLLSRAGLLPDEPKRLASALGEMRAGREPEPRELVQAIDAIAVEVERIGEGQRFLTKLLAERDPRARRSGNSPIPGAIHSPIPPAS